jgi:hypothetical protein
VQAALIGHYRNGGKCTVHLVSSDPAGQVAQLLKRYPRFEKCCKLQTSQLSQSGDFVSRAAEVISALPPAAFCTVFLCSGEDGAMFTEALMLRDLLPHSDRFRVILASGEDSYFRDIVEKNPAEGPALARWISFAAASSVACGKDAVFGESLDRLAERIHSVWYSANEKAIQRAVSVGDTVAAAALRSKATCKGWSQLSESQKDLNRFAADHIPVKMRAAGLDPRDQFASREKWSRLDDQTLEMLTRMEHERWCAAMWLGGWIWAQERDSSRHHPDLIPFDELSGESKLYDLEQVRAIGDYFAG